MDPHPLRDRDRPPLTPVPTEAVEQASGVVASGVVEPAPTEPAPYLPPDPPPRSDPPKPSADAVQGSRKRPW
jgi:hypothetical protein